MTETVTTSDVAVLRTGAAEDLQLPIVPSSEGSAGVDVTKLLSRTGLVTYDPSFANTASCASGITYIDGDAGILRYRG